MSKINGDEDLKVQSDNEISLEDSENISNLSIEDVKSAFADPNPQNHTGKLEDSEDSNNTVKRFDTENSESEYEEEEDIE